MAYQSKGICRYCGDKDTDWDGLWCVACGKFEMQCMPYATSDVFLAVADVLAGKTENHFQVAFEVLETLDYNMPIKE